MSVMPRRRQPDPLAAFNRRENERELEDSVGRLYFDLRGRELREVSRPVRTKIAKAARAAIAAFEAGTLRGARARRRINAIQDRLWDAIERTRVTCPACGTRV